MGVLTTGGTFPGRGGDSRHRLCGLALLASLGGCVPTLEDRTSIVEASRVLAVRAEPAEAGPGAAITLSALWADPAGADVDAPPIDWALCRDPVALSELLAVSPRCLAVTAPYLVPLGQGARVSALLPDDACRLFGPTPPDPPAAQDGQQAPSPRPVDPDATLGYYQPVRLLAGTGGGPSYSTFRARLRCGLAGAPRDLAVEYAARRRDNENPRIVEVTAATAAGAVALTDNPVAPLTVSPAAALALAVRWPACPDQGVCGDGVCGDDEDASTCAADCARPRGCQGSELYLVYDPTTRSLARRREAMRVSWFATAGRFDGPRSGVEGAPDAATSSSNRWTAPAGGERMVRLWVVVRDDRGGVDYQALRVRVRP